MHLRREIELCLRHTGMTPTRFGREAARDPRLVFQIRNGREVRKPLERRIRDFIISMHEASA